MSSIIQDAVAGLGRSEGPADERPLTDQERQLVARLLSDPFAFPQTFKAWLIAFLESSDLTLPISSIQGLGSTLGIGGEGNTSFVKGLFPPGAILGWGSSRIPNGCLRCDGTAYSRTAYAALFKEIGTQWGAGDGATTFNVPDLRRRMPIGAGSTGYGIGSNEGRAESARAPEHHHYFQDTKGLVGGVAQSVGNHSHGYQRAQPATAIIDRGSGSYGQASYVYGLSYDGPSTDAGGGHSHSVTGNVTINADTTGGFDQDKSAYLAIHFIIVT